MTSRESAECVEQGFFLSANLFHSSCFACIIKIKVSTIASWNYRFCDITHLRRCPMGLESRTPPTYGPRFRLKFHGTNIKIPFEPNRFLFTCQAFFGRRLSVHCRCHLEWSRTCLLEFIPLNCGLITRVWTKSWWSEVNKTEISKLEKTEHLSCSILKLHKFKPKAVKSSKE